MAQTAEKIPYITSQSILDSLKKKVHKLSYLHEVSHRINTIQNIDELLDYALTTALSSLSSASGSIFLWDEESEQLCLKRVIGKNKKELEGITQRLGEGISGLVAKEKRPVLVKNIKTDPRFSPNEKTGYRSDSFLCVPMVARNKLVGVMNVTEKQTNTPFNFDELEFLFILSNHVAIAVDNLTLYEKLSTFNTLLEEKVSDATHKLEKIVEHSLILQHYKEDILESLTTGIFVLDKDNRITLWNRGMELQYGLKREAVIGKPFGTVVRHSTINTLMQAIHEVHETGRHITREAITHRVNGNEEERVINYKMFPLRTEGRTHRGVVVLLDDVSEKMKMEEQLRTHERLAAIGKLSAGIAHELNNPLDGTQRYLNLSLDALERTDTNLPREFIMNAKEGVTRMIKIVRSLLEFSQQARSGGSETVNVNDVIRDIIAFYQADKAIAASVTIDMQLAKGWLPVLDYGLQTVVSNICKNAFDALDGKGRLTVISEQLTLEGNHKAKITITDTGPGIADEVKRRIFEPFFTTKKMGSGTGLGLSICQEIIHRSGGEITVHTECGKGTAFVILLPLLKKEEHTVNINREVTL